MKIKDIVGKDKNGNSKKVKFLRYGNGNLIYITDCGFEFPIPASELGNSVIAYEEKAILFMKYIKRHISEIEKDKI